MTALTVTETASLVDCETVIDGGLRGFIAVGTALLTIRDERLYRAEYPTFEEYCQQRWSMGRASAYRVMQAAQVAELVSPMGDIPNERQARELAVLLDQPEKLNEVWSETVERTHGRPTAAAVREVRDAVRPGQKPFTCMCGESFDREVWHCPADAHHWSLDEQQCRNCYADRPASEPSTVDPATGEILPDGQSLIEWIDSRNPDAAAERAQLDLRARWSRLMSRVAEIPTMNPEHVSAVLDDLDYSLASGVARDVVRFLDRVGEHRRPGLRAVGGDK